MSMYTPTTPEVKRWFAGAIDEYRCDTGLSREEAEQGFDRWLQATITEASKPLERMVQELEAENTRLQTELAEAESRLTELPKPRSLEYPASEFEGLTEQKIASEYAFAVAGGSVNSFEAERKRVLAWAAHIRAEAAEAALAGDPS